MVLLRLALRIDRRLLIAAAGWAAAALLPLTVTLVASGLEATVAGDERVWIAEGPEGIQDISGADVALAWGRVEGLDLYAFMKGDPGLLPGTGYAMPDAGMGPMSIGLDAASRPSVDLSLVPPDGLLVHPDRLPDGIVVAATPGPGAMVPEGAVDRPLRGTDAFEEGGLGEVRTAFWAITVASVPVTAFIGYAFGTVEIRERARTRAALAALGHPRLGERIFQVRMVFLAGLGAGLAASAAAAMYLFGSALFHPTPFPGAALWTAGLVPSLVGLLVATVAIRVGEASALDLLRAPPGEDLASRRLPVPMAVRPIVVGTAMVPALLVVGLLFALDVGLPLAAADIPAAITGGDEEWVIGLEKDRLFMGGTSAQAAEALRYHEDIDRTVAEILVPTAIGNDPVLARGGDWDDLREYHGLALADGGPPGNGQILLGMRLAGRTGLSIGDSVYVQASGQPWALPLTVVGVYDHEGLLGDEAVLDMDTAARLAGKGPGQATLVRVSPGNLAAYQAVEASVADLRVVDLRMIPASPVAGSTFQVQIDVANVASIAGTRPLDIRVDGDAVAGLVASVPARSVRTFTATAIAPDGPFRIDVNPSLEARATEAPLRLDVPAIAFVGSRFTVAVADDAGDPVSGAMVLWQDGPDGKVLASVPTDRNGTASFVPRENGTHVVRVGEMRVPVPVGDAEDAHRSALRVEAVWTVPGPPVLGQTNQLQARVRNLGGVAGSAGFNITLDDQFLAHRDLTLDPGQATILDIPLYLVSDAEAVHVGDFTRELDPVAPAGGGGGSRVAPSADRDVRHGTAVQAQAADRVLGDARSALLGVAIVSLASSLAVVALVTERVVQGRRRIVSILEGLGRSPDWIRMRGALEAATLAALCALVALVLARFVFWIGRMAAWPVLFGHVLPDPLGVLVHVQVMTAFAVLAGLVTYHALGRAFEEETEAEPLDLAKVLEGP